MRTAFLAAALAGGLAAPLAAAEIEPFRVVSAGGMLARDIAAGLVDAAQARQSSPFLSREAYLALKPQPQTGGMPRMPDLLANGKCSDPAGEGR